MSNTTDISTEKSTGSQMGGGGSEHWRPLTEWSPEVGALDVVRVHLAGLSEQQRATAVQLLAPDERARAGRLVVPQKRAQFIAARAGLRRVLAIVCETSPHELHFGSGEHGKPFLEPLTNRALPAVPPSFNLSHSGEWGLIGINSSGRIGCDIEVVSSARPLIEIARRFFSPEEFETLRRSSGKGRSNGRAGGRSSDARDDDGDLAGEGQRSRGNDADDANEGVVARLFYRGWTRKEAYVKAIGTGLTFSSRRFVVSLREHSGRHLKSSEFPGEEPRRWSFFDLDVAPGYDASVCVDTTPQIVRLWDGTAP